MEKEDDTEQVNGDCSDEDAALDGVVNMFRPDASIYRVPILHSDEGRSRISPFLGLLLFHFLTGLV